MSESPIERGNQYFLPLIHPNKSTPLFKLLYSLISPSGKTD
jgi:hypothetical protein